MERWDKLEKNPGWILNSPVFLVKVGTGLEQRSFTVHRDVLSQSPVFERMCNGPYTEAATGVIELPEDDPVGMGHVIEYLYFMGLGKIYRLRGHDSIDARVTFCALADKYSIVTAKRTLLDGLVRELKDEDKPIHVLEISKKILQTAPDIDRKRFDEYLLDVVRKMAADPGHRKTMFDFIEEMIEAGEPAAVPMFRVWRESVQSHAEASIDDPEKTCVPAMEGLEI